EVFNILIVSTYLLIVNPIFFKKYSFGEKEYKKKLNKIIDIFILISGIYFVSMSVGIKFIFHFLNKEYMNSIIITEIITLSYIFLGLSQLISSIILIKEKIRVTVIFTIIAGITNIILNYCWIPKYEAVGAALATMICYILILIISFLYSQRLLNLELIYENKIKIIIINVSFIFLIKLIDLENLYTDFILKIFIFFIYILMIYLLKLEPLINKYIRNKIKNI
uniref:lipopolysaccharide biosynthesis protein n=1 Tax=Fusobacterium varium TaxID=856 RepID=UPI0022E6B947